MPIRHAWLLAVLALAAHAQEGDAALAKLLEGNARYVESRASRPDQTAERRTEVANGQHPFALVLGCADSRVPPEIVFDQGLGDLFVIRVAGNVLDDQVLASIEYGVHHLHIPLVIVLGHERCGAVAATVDAEKSGSTPGGHIGGLVEAIRPAVKEVAGEADPVDAGVRSNVRHVVDELLEEEVIRELVEKHGLRVVGGRYDLDTGRVDILGDE